MAANACEDLSAMTAWLKDKWDGLFEFEVPADGKKAKNATNLATLYWTLVLILLGAFTFQILSTNDHYELGTPSEIGL